VLVSRTRKRTKTLAVVPVRVGIKVNSRTDNE
jgi:hypothetical protein